MYFKITNSQENHNGFQYVDGLNILTEKFNDDANDSCCAGGFYFTDVTNIFKFIGFGVFLREVKLPTENPQFKIIKDKDHDKWRSNMIILGKRRDLFTVSVFEYLIKNGAKAHVNDDCVLRYSAQEGHFYIVKYLIENGANIHAIDDSALRCSAARGRLDIVKYLVENGANIHADNDSALIYSATNGHLDLVKYLIEKDMNANNKYALRYSAANGHLPIVKYLKSKIKQPN